jgi:hypothetical protein
MTIFRYRTDLLICFIIDTWGRLARRVHHLKITYDEKV